MSITEARPNKLMGTLPLAFMVVAMASPVGIVVGTVPLMIGYGNGIGTPGMVVLIAAVLVVFAFGFAAIANAEPSAGGFFGFIRAGLGPRAGMAAGFVSGGAYAILTVYVAALLAYFTNNFFVNRFDVDLGWAVWGVVIVVAVTILTRLGVRESALVTAALLTVEFTILGVLVVGVAVSQGGGAFPLSSFAPSEVFDGAPGFALALAFLSFIGFEVTAVFTSHARDPERTIGRATILGLLLIAFTFCLGAWATIAGAGEESALMIAQGPEAGTLVPDVASANVGTWMGSTFDVVMLTSLVATMIAVFNTTSQYLLTLSRTFTSTGPLSRLHPTHQSPANAGLAVSIAVCLLLVGCRVAGLDPYLEVASRLGILGATGVFGLEIACSIAIAVYFARKNDRRIWRTRVAPITAAIALTACLVLVLANYSSLAGSTSALVTWSPLIFALLAVAGWLSSRHQVDDAVDEALAPSGRRL